MKVIIRILAVIIVAPVTYYFVYWPLLLLLAPFNKQLWVLILTTITPLLCAIAAGWAIFNKKLEPVNLKLLSSILIGAVILGAFGFLTGFIGPILCSPEANQGPLLGFFTGPLGFLTGGIAGGIYWAIQHRDARSD